MVEVFVAVIVGLALLQWGWPQVVGWSIQRENEDERARWVHDNIGLVIIVLTGVLAVGLASWFVTADGENTWTDPQPAAAALGVTVGAVFVYSRLFPPAFRPSFYPVTDFETGEWEPVKRQELAMKVGRLWPVFLEAHNTGITPWNNYRITVRFEGGFELFPKHPNMPCSSAWVWPTTFRRKGHSQDFLQVQGGNTLAVAEAQTVRFVVMTPNEEGRFKVVITVVADGRLSESKRQLWVNVTDDPGTPAIPHVAAASPTP